MITPTKELKVFYSYSHKDQEFCQELENHLSNLKRRYHLQTWFDRQIKPGENWEAERSRGFTWPGSTDMKKNNAFL